MLSCGNDMYMTRFQSDILFSQSPLPIEGCIILSRFLLLNKLNMVDIRRGYIILKEQSSNMAQAFEKRDILFKP